MAILYTFTVTKLDHTIANFPPSMEEWNTTVFAPANDPRKLIISSEYLTGAIYPDATSLKAFTDLLKLTAPQQAAVTEWATAHGITYTHAVYELPELTIDGINWVS